MVSSMVKLPNSDKNQSTTFRCSPTISISEEKRKALSYAEYEAWLSEWEQRWEEDFWEMEKDG